MGRKHERYQIGSTVEFEYDGNYYQGVVGNSSSGGILITLNEDVPQGLFVGHQLDIHLNDIFSDMKYTFPSKITRKFDREFAIEFIQPLIDSQKKFLERWLNWQV